MTDPPTPCPCGAEWRDGVPVNLEAAAADALAWLWWIRDYHLLSGSEMRERLDACIAALEEQFRARGEAG